MNEDNAKEYLLSRNPTLVNTFLINKWPIDCSSLSKTCVAIAETDSGLSDFAVQFWSRFVPCLFKQHPHRIGICHEEWTGLYQNNLLQCL